MSSPFASVARVLHERGYSIIPIRPGFKIPGERKIGFWDHMEGWAQFCERQCSEDELERWGTWPKAGIAICTGPASRVVALDFDTHEDLWPRLESLIPRSPVVKRGEKGFTAFYQFSGELSKNWSIAQ